MGEKSKYCPGAPRQCPAQRDQRGGSGRTCLVRGGDAKRTTLTAHTMGRTADGQLVEEFERSEHRVAAQVTIELCRNQMMQSSTRSLGAPKGTFIVMSVTLNSYQRALISQSAQNRARRSASPMRDRGTCRPMSVPSGLMHQFVITRERLFSGLTLSRCTEACGTRNENCG
jgi:hypothetical protein